MIVKSYRMKAAKSRRTARRTVHLRRMVVADPDVLDGGAVRPVHRENRAVRRVAAGVDGVFDQAVGVIVVRLLRPDDALEPSAVAA